MIAVDEERLENDLEYRFDYLCDFVGFGSADRAAIQASAMYLGPTIPEFVEATYSRLLSFDATARHFLPPQHGCDAAPAAKLADVASSAQVAFRKEHLARYFMQLLGRTLDKKMVPYLDMVGKIHTRAAGNGAIHVPLVQMNALMGLLSDILIDAIARTPLDEATKFGTIRAFQKFFWIQNDFIARHYA